MNMQYVTDDCLNVDLRNSKGIKPIFVMGVSLSHIRLYCESRLASKLIQAIIYLTAQTDSQEGCHCQYNSNSTTDVWTHMYHFSCNIIVILQQMYGYTCIISLVI